MLKDSVSEESRSRKVARKLHGGWGETDIVGPVNIVFNASFQFTSSRYILRLVNCESLGNVHF